MFRIVSSLVFVFVGIAAFAQPQPEKLKQVADGRLQEARASWWGFDAADSTKSLQAAIDSKVPKLIVDTMPTPWIVEPLRLTSDQEIVFEKDCIVQAKRGAFKGKSDSLLTIVSQKNVALRGEKGATLRMWIDDYHAAPYEAAEWRHGINIKSSENIVVEGLTIADSGGDGIYLGVAKRGVPCKNIRIADVVCDNNNRQGISVISAEKLLIENTIMKNTKGTAPKAGIDFEPNHPSEVLIDCVMKNCVTENNGGCGYAFYLVNMHRSSTPISVRIESCVSSGDASSAFAFSTGNAPDETVRGTVEVVGCRFEKSGDSGIFVRSKPTAGVALSFDNIVVDRCGGKPDTPAIRLTAGVHDESPVGNVYFRSVSVIDPTDRPFFDYKDGTRFGLGLENVDGTIEVDRNGRKSLHKIDAAWIQERFPVRVLKRIPQFELSGVPFVPLREQSGDDNQSVPLLRSRNRGEFWFYAEKGSPLRFTFQQGQVGRYSGEERKVKFTAPSGKGIPLPNLKFKEDTDYQLDRVPETGVYRFNVDVGANWVGLKKTNRPVVLAGIPRDVHLISTRGEFFFFVPEGTKEFGVRVSGEGAERVKASLFDPSGNEVWSADDIEEVVPFEGSAPGVWKIVFDKPTHGTFEDFYLSLVGIPPLLGFSPDLLLKP